MNILVGGQDDLLLCHRGCGGHAARPLPPMGARELLSSHKMICFSVTEAVGAMLHRERGSRFLPTPPCKGHGLHVSLSLTHLLPIGSGERVTKSQ